jgi:signal transduction histidine kinase
MEKDPAKAAAALAEIKATSKAALDEVRSVLGVLRSEAGADGSPLAPEPDLSQLERLAVSVTGQGVAVRLDVDPDLQRATVPRPLQLALYRIVQESLTNVLRLAQASTATVSVRREGDHYVAEVVDDGRGDAVDPTDSVGGRGILGMRERAELLGGTLDVGRAPGGGYRVLARIPLPGRDSS